MHGSGVGGRRPAGRKPQGSTHPACPWWRPPLPLPTSDHSTLALQPCSWAVPVNTSVTRRRSSAKCALLKARIVPDRSTWSGMTLEAPGAVANRLTLTTPPCSGSVSRDTSGCSATTAICG